MAPTLIENSNDFHAQVYVYRFYYKTITDARKEQTLLHGVRVAVSTKRPQT